MRIALVHDYLNQYGGAERVLEALVEIFPKAPIFTLVHSPKKLLNGNSSLATKDIKTSFLQKFPLAKSHHRLFPLLMPLAIEKFDFSDFDIVFSDSASFAKGIITKPNTLHICYCYTPLRYAWDDSHKYIKEFTMLPLAKFFIPFFMNYIRLWDREAAMRVDRFICTSKFVSKRIEKYYKKKANVIYPPVNIGKFSIPNEPSENYFLMVGRLLAYKRFDIAIEAFNKLKIPLKIIGEGPERKKLEKRSNENIQFLGEVSDKDLEKHYQKAQALIFPQEEDFGIVVLEAMACGKPVIAYRGGGALESIKEKETGIFFDKQTPEDLIRAVKDFSLKKFNSEKIRDHVLKFDKEIFKKKIKEFVEKQYESRS